MFFYNINLLSFYCVVYLFMIIIFNVLPVNEEFYISMGLFFFLIYIYIFITKIITAILNKQVETEFNVFVNLLINYYNFLICNYKYFKFELLFWLLLINLSNIFYMSKKNLVNINFQGQYYYMYNLNIYFYGLIKNFMIYYYNQLITFGLSVLKSLVLSNNYLNFFNTANEKNIANNNLLIMRLFIKSLI